MEQEAKLLFIEDEQGNVVSTQDISNLQSGEHKLTFNFNAEDWQGKMRVYTTGMYPGSVKIKNVSCGSPVTYDEHWDNVVLLMHMDGNATDSSSVESILAISGGSFVDATSGFGQEYSTENAADNSGINHIYLSTPSIIYDLNGTEDFCIEAFITVTANMISGASASVAIQLSEFYQDVAYAILVRNDSIGVYASLQYIIGGGSNTIASTSSGKYLTLNQKYHIAGTREGNVYRLFIDGSVVASVTNITRGTESAKYVGIGATWNGQRGFPGRVDDLRITKGVARYTQTFPIPTEPFATNALPSITPKVLQSKSVELFWSIATEPTKFAPQDLQWVIGPYNHTIQQDVYFSVIPLSTKDTELIWSTYPMLEKDIELSWVNKPTIEQEIRYTVAPSIGQIVQWSNHRTLSTELGWEIGYYKDQQLSYVISPTIYSEIEYTIGSTISTEINWTIANYSTKDLLWSIEG